MPCSKSRKATKPGKKSAPKPVKKPSGKGKKKSGY